MQAMAHKSMPLARIRRLGDASTDAMSSAFSGLQAEGGTHPAGGMAVIAIDPATADDDAAAQRNVAAAALDE